MLELIELFFYAIIVKFLKEVLRVIFLRVINLILHCIILFDYLLLQGDSIFFINFLQLAILKGY